MQDVRESVDVAALLVDAVQARYLDQPSNVVAEEFVVDNPFGKLVPLGGRAAIDADSPFAVLANVNIWASAKMFKESLTWYLLCSKSVITSERCHLLASLPMSVTRLSPTLGQLR